MKKKIIIALTAVLIIAIAALAFFLITFETIPENTKIINQNMLKLKGENRSTPFSDVTPFVWDRAYILEDPYYDGGAIDKIVGAETNLKRLETEVRRRIVFVNQGKFVYDYIYNISEFTFRPFGTLELTTSDTIRIAVGTSKALIVQVEP
ncbi:hypothetical protein [Paenibacillus sp. FSL H8-0537]|uniref:hypothetical protein n=1 Tax=Paenibacillus sp. FSL H8-0537 TaxID=2921399 RepID=UPI0031014B7F